MSISFIQTFLICARRLCVLCQLKMMEKFDYAGQEEYIWAMRTKLYTDDTEAWKENSFIVEDMEVMKKKSSSQTNVDDHKTRIIASLVPDEIIYDCNDYAHRPYDVCLLFGDVSGFTELCEKYNISGKGGPSRLTHVLNSYIGTMVQEIMSYNGDVLKFSGDAFLAMWKSSTNDSMQDCVHQALDCALVIQKTHGKYETDVGIFLRVKLAISAGFVIFSNIGDDKMSHYIVIGNPIFEVKIAERKSNPGDIIVCHTAWNYLNPSEYLSEYMDDGIHIKVNGLGANWRSAQKNYNRVQKTLDDEERQSKTGIIHMNEEFSIRPSVNEAVKTHLKEDLRKYIIPPVMRGIDMEEPLEYLTEMRQIVILFINVVARKMPLKNFANLVDRCYKIVCKITDRMEGCVNKVSLFDKDLMFVVIFGFRGFKHDLDSQIGLRCASECFEGLNKLRHVKSTSIGVTTGMTYCGVVGHTLRREYTVISVNVNKAARLMCAYPNKVTCDRETFLHSKLQAKNFILQEYKYLKGISKAGPVYEFKETEIDPTEKTFVAKYPLLGRDDELRLFLKYMLNFHEVHLQRSQNAHGGLKMLAHHNTLVFAAKSRQGKSRLIDEIVYVNPKDIPIFKIKLTLQDAQRPYKTIQSIFAVSLGITPASTVKDREARLMTRLRKMKVPELLCLLNPIFNVNFEKTSLFMTLTSEQKYVATKKMIKQLCYGCFVVLWVIAIENAENIDPESWPLIKAVVESDVCFLTFSLNLSVMSLEGGHPGLEVMHHQQSRIVKLLPIDKLYHAGLACQILEVQAIPPELEKVLQTRSHGNPGWIESFLISLLQGGGLHIKYVDEMELESLGLVVPPVEMLYRSSPEEIFNSLMSQDINYKQKQLDWTMYRFSYRESKTNFPNDVTETEGKQIPICLINDNANIEDVDAELSLDVLIIKTYDSLSSYQQLLLKCSSVIGDTVPRDMLNYVMSSNNPRQTAQAVQRLMEIRVFGCAYGDFTQGDPTMMFTMRLIDLNRDMAIKCGCKGIRVHESCLDLPKYASCGYFRFRLGTFRETTYNLLTDSQRKEFHARAVRYLEKETRKCKACGNAFFVRILGVRYDEGLRKKTKHITKSKRRSVSDYWGVHRNKSGVSTTLSGDNRSQVTSFTTGSESRHSAFRRLSSEILRDNWLAIRTVRRLRYRTSLTKTFSYADYSNCQCPQILSSMYNQLIEHCEGSDKEFTSKLMNAMLEYAYLCILSYNVPQAMKVLDRATLFLNTRDSEELGEGTKWKIPLIQAKIDTLVGRCHIELGQSLDAYTSFMTAIDRYGIAFPSSTTSLKSSIRCMTVKLKLNMFCWQMNVGTKQGYEAEYCDEVSDCLSIMFDLFMDMNMKKRAEFAALLSFNKAMQSDSDFFTLCNAYANMIRISHQNSNHQTALALEIQGLRLCHRKKTTVEPQELKSVAKLYGAIFCMRFVRGEIEHAIDLGFVMLRISNTIHAITYSMQVMPLLIQALIYRKRIMEAVTVLFELEYLSEEDIDNSGRIWYYALSVGIHLETGYTVIPYNECERLYHIEGEAVTTVRDPAAERRYYTVMWLWCLRVNDWESATLWYSKIKDFTIIGKKTDTLANIFTALYLLEGLLIFMVGKMDRRNIDALVFAYKEIEELMSILEQTSKTVKAIAPRFYHLKAFYKFIRYEEGTALNLLQKTKSLAVKLENALEESFADHSEKAWSNKLSTVVLNFWVDHCDITNIVDYHEIEANYGKLNHYTFPMPLYV